MAMSWANNNWFWRTEGDVLEKKTSIHTPNSPVGSWVHKLFGFVPSEDYELAEAYCSTLVWRAIKVLSEPMASMPIGVFEKQKNGDIVKIDHPYEYTLNTEASRYYSANTWKDTQMHHIALGGNGYSRIILRGNGEAEFLTIDPERVNDIILMEDQLRYKVDGINKMLSASEVLHFVGPSWNGFVGKNVLDCHKDTLILDREMRNYAKKFYQNGAFLGGVLTSPTSVSEPAYRRLKNTWNDLGGTDGVNKTQILEEGMDYKPLKLDPVTAGWGETRKQLAVEIARIWGVPLHMLMELDRSTFNNIEHQDLELVKYTLTPWVTRWESELNRKLFPRKDKGKRFIRFDMTELLRADLSSMADYLTGMQTAGNLSVNEVRRKFLHLPGVKGGDKNLVQGNNMVPLEQVAKGAQQELEFPQAEADIV